MHFIIDNQTEETIQNNFDKIAKELLNNYQLKLNATLYQFKEIEFYFYCSPQHEDGFTYPHKIEAGKLRPHDSGIDLTLRSIDRVGYGGILIRAIQRIDNSEEIKGPLKVVKEILRQFENIFQSNSIQIVSSNSDKDKKMEVPKRTVRVGLIKPQSKTPIDKYRFTPYKYFIS